MLSCPRQIRFWCIIHHPSPACDDIIMIGMIDAIDHARVCRASTDRRVYAVFALRRELRVRHASLHFYNINILCLTLMGMLQQDEGGSTVLMILTAWCSVSLFSLSLLSTAPSVSRLSVLCISCPACLLSALLCLPVYGAWCMVHFSLLFSMHYMC